jgi:glycosyltransferase involved in cell wall biosynthesis
MLSVIKDKMFLDDPCRIYDCSNSTERPSHRGGGGPVMNDIMRYLHERAGDYYFKFVDSAEDASVIITNDVFPESVLNLGKPLIKMMCAPFWQKDMQYRNEVLNKAATQADLVIFITEYSRQQYFYHGGLPLKNHCVVRNWVDPSIFMPCDVLPEEHEFSMTACATNWNRKEERLSDFIKFAEANSNILFTLIGTLEQKLPSNMISLGYLSNPKDIAYIINSSDGFINLSYRDAATNTVPQAISCGLPVIFANSGGVAEMVKNPYDGPDFGIPIPDHQSLEIENEVPSLNLEDMQVAFETYRNNFKLIKSFLIKSFDSKLAFRKMLDGYFGNINKYL